MYLIVQCFFMFDLNMYSPIFIYYFIHNRKIFIFKCYDNSYELLPAIEVLTVVTLEESSRFYDNSKKKWEVAGSDVLMSQCSPGESIETTSFGQHDRQTDLSRTFYFVYFWSPEDFSSIQKYSKMEKTGKKNL